MNRNFFTDFFHGELKSKTTKEWLKVVRKPGFEDYIYVASSDIMWETIQKPYSLPFEVLDKIIKYLYFYNYANNVHSIPEEFLIRYKDAVPWNYLLSRRQFSKELILKCIDTTGAPSIIMTQRLTNDFLKELEKIVEKDNGDEYVASNFWDALSRSLVVREEYLIENIEKVNWTLVSMRNNLTFDFISEYKNKLDWESVSSYRAFTAKDLECFENYIDWNKFQERDDITEDIMRKYENKLDFGTVIIWGNGVPVDILDRQSHKFDNLTWRLISTGQVLDYNFIIKNLNKLDLKAFIKKNKESLDNLTKEERDEIMDLYGLQETFV